MNGPNRPVLLTLASHASSLGFDLSDFVHLDNDLHAELYEYVFKVVAILRGAPDEYPLYLLQGIWVEAKVSVQAFESAPIAVGDLVLLPEELGAQRDDWFTLRRLLPKEEHNRRVSIVSASLKPHLEALGDFATGLGLSEVSTGVEVDADPTDIRVAAVAKSILADGTHVDIRAEVTCDNLVGEFPGYSGTIIARRWRCVDGEQTSSLEMESIEAGMASSADPIRLFTAFAIFEDVEDEGKLVYVMDELDLRSQLAQVDFKKLRLHEHFD